MSYRSESEHSVKPTRTTAPSVPEKKTQRLDPNNRLLKTTPRQSRYTSPRSLATHPSMLPVSPSSGMGSPSQPRSSPLLPRSKPTQPQSSFQTSPRLVSQERGSLIPIPTASATRKSTSSDFRTRRDRVAPSPRPDRFPSNNSPPATPEAYTRDYDHRSLSTPSLVATAPPPIPSGTLTAQLTKPTTLPYAVHYLHHVDHHDPPLTSSHDFTSIDDFFLPAPFGSESATSTADSYTFSPVTPVLGGGGGSVRFQSPSVAIVDSNSSPSAFSNNLWSFPPLVYGPPDWKLLSPSPLSTPPQHYHHPAVEPLTSPTNLEHHLEPNSIEAKLTSPLKCDVDTRCDHKSSPRRQDTKASTSIPSSANVSVRKVATSTTSRIPLQQRTPKLQNPIPPPRQSSKSANTSRYLPLPTSLKTDVSSVLKPSIVSKPPYAIVSKPPYHEAKGGLSPPNRPSRDGVVSLTPSLLHTMALTHISPVVDQMSTLTECVVERDITPPPPPLVDSSQKKQRRVPSTRKILGFAPNANQDSRELEKQKPKHQKIESSDTDLIRGESGAEKADIQLNNEDSPPVNPKRASLHRRGKSMAAVPVKPSSATTKPPPIPRLAGRSNSDTTTLDTFLHDRISPVVIIGGGMKHESSTQPSRLPVSSPAPSLAVERQHTATKEERKPAKLTKESRSMGKKSIKKTKNVTEGIASPEASSTASRRPPFEEEVSYLSESESETRGTRRKLVKNSKKSRKWNLLGRTQDRLPFQSYSEDNISSTMPVVAQKATIADYHSAPKAFYLMLDEEDDKRLFVQNTEDSDPDFRGYTSAPTTLSQRTDSVSPNSVASPPPIIVKYPAPSPPPKTPLPKIPTTAKSRTNVTGKDGPSTPSRLPRVGRIPKQTDVMASQRKKPETPNVADVRKERELYNSQRSFSRPFQRSGVPLTSMDKSGDRVNASLTQTAIFKSEQDDASLSDFIAKGPSPPRSTIFKNTEALLLPDSVNTTFSPSLLPQKTGMFLQFYADDRTHKGYPESPSRFCLSTSDLSDCQSDDSLPDMTTTVGTNTLGRDVDEEVWEEFDDLLGFVSSEPSRAVFEREESLRAARESAEIARVSTICGAGITDCLHSMMSPVPLDTHSYQDLTPVRKRPNPRGSPVQSESVTASSSASTANPTTTTEQYPPETIRNSIQSDHSVSDDNDDTRTVREQINLRVGSMTVSKWLTFGHVLFSPIREIASQKGGSDTSILVLDGLDNDDWSFYMAETYPNAKIFNLSPRAPLVDRSAISNLPSIPHNHLQIQYTSHRDKFPFGNKVFSAVIYRFPRVAPDENYRNIISEARRVLKPGGFLELCVLDVDLNNMGARGRRRIRQLKEKLQRPLLPGRETKPPNHPTSPSLKSETNAPLSDAFHTGSISDLILRLLGTEKFRNIKECRVGLPVVLSAAQRRIQKEGAINKNSSGTDSNDQNIGQLYDGQDLADIMNDDGDQASATISALVTRVGRWWYRQCYEKEGSLFEYDSASKSHKRYGRQYAKDQQQHSPFTLPKQQRNNRASNPSQPLLRETTTGRDTIRAKSIWSDGAFRRECSDLSSSFKLMICYAQAPPERRIRGKSV